ncbi:hypothetical protein ACFSTC_05610 [Nonomuraea ferruginea]
MGAANGGIPQGEVSGNPRARSSVGPGGLCRMRGSRGCAPPAAGPPGDSAERDGLASAEGFQSGGVGRERVAGGSRAGGGGFVGGG